MGGSRALPNLEVVQRILEATGQGTDLIEYVKDRPGHDRRYAITSEKLEQTTGWRAEVDFEQGLAETVAWYRDNPEWLANVRSGAYREYYDRQYGKA